MDKRYQVFISSTYADLKDERRTVMQTVIQMNCLPAGMELFPAVDEEQFAFIKRVIDDSDYYILIIGGRYGSVEENGVSYTEKEYDYAVARGLKVIALLHENPDDISFGKSEQDPALRERLNIFRERVTKNRLVKFWNEASELPGLVALALSSTMTLFPAVGWMRADKLASEDLLNEINDLRKQNGDLFRKVTALEAIPPIEGLASLDETIKIPATYHHTRHGTVDWGCDPTWRQIFGFISPYLLENPSDYNVKTKLALALHKANDRAAHATYQSIDDQTFKTIGLQLKALGLVRLQYAATTKGSMAMFWSLTPKGERLMMELRTVQTLHVTTTDSAKLNQE
jgi:hypothetical protein